MGVARTWRRDVEAALAANRSAEERLAFLAEASSILATSLDYETTLQTVAKLAVPRIADWCAVDLLSEDGSLERLAVEHVDPAKVEWARELQRRNPPDPALAIDAHAISFLQLSGDLVATYVLLTQAA